MSIGTSAPLCPLWFMFFACSRKSPSPLARTSILLQSRPRNRATCPWRELPSILRATVASRLGLVLRGACEKTAAPVEDLRYTAGRSSYRGSASAQAAEQLRAVDRTLQNRRAFQSSPLRHRRSTPREPVISFPPQQRPH